MRAEEKGGREGERLKGGRWKRSERGGSQQVRQGKIEITIARVGGVVNGPWGSRLPAGRAWGTPCGKLGQSRVSQPSSQTCDWLK